MNSFKFTTAHVKILLCAVVMMGILYPVTAHAATKRPVVTSISVKTGSTKGGTKVTISGKNFTKKSKVTFGSKKAKSVKYVSKKKLTVVTPARSKGKANVYVKTSGGKSKKAKKGAFTYGVSPAIKKLSTTKGSTAGKNKITITGSGFVKGTTVTFGSTKASKVSIKSSKKLTVTVPKRAAGKVKVTARSKYGASKTNTKTTYTYSKPVTNSKNSLKVATFNVTVASATKEDKIADAKEKNEKPLMSTWPNRVGTVVSQIKREAPDVLAVQEASAGTKELTDSGEHQFADLALKLGEPYALTNEERYCDGVGRAAVCPNGASSSDRIFYNTERVEMLEQGARKLDAKANNVGGARHMTWATFKDLNTKKKFFVASAHLEPDESREKRKETTRLGMAKIILEEIAIRNTQKLPVVLLGDFSSTKFQVTNKAHTHFIEEGKFIDPLVNTPKYKGSWLTETAVGAHYSSLNNFNTTPQIVAGNYPIGSYVDYILVSSKKFELLEWKTVVDVDKDGNFLGTVPSDHNMMWLSLQLP